MTSTRTSSTEATTQAGPPGSVRLALATLTAVTFVIGTAELMVVGILGLIARDQGVSISTAGYLVTAYALGIAVGAPVITALTARFGQRAVLRVALVVFLAGNLLAVLSTTFELFVLARLVTGSLHGLIAGVATAVAARLVVPERRGRAISLVVGGITVSTVVGVPAGTLVGQSLGWHAAFVTIIALTGLVLAATLRWVPAVPRPHRGAAGARARAAFAPRVLVTLAVGMLLFGGQFVAFTYLEPFLAEVTGVSGGLTSVFLLVYGLAAMAGTLLGGRAADRNAPATLLVANAALAVALGALHLVGPVPALVVIALIAWGTAGFAIAPALLLRASVLAGTGGDLAPTLGISAFNAGIAVGSAVGGVIITGYGAEATVLAALVVTVLALPATWATGRLRVPDAADA